MSWVDSLIGGIVAILLIEGLFSPIASIVAAFRESAESAHAEKPLSVDTPEKSANEKEGAD